MRIQKLIIAGAASAIFTACGQKIENDTQWITIDNKTGSEIRARFPDSAELIAVTGDTSVLALTPDAAGPIGEFMHENTHRCGGYFSFDNENDATYFQLGQNLAEKPVPVLDYTIDQAEVVTQMTAKVDGSSIVSLIKKLSSYHNRYFRSDTGSDSQQWLKSHWESLGTDRDDFSVELVQHSSWPQPSVVATIVGSESPDEIIVVGGHGDSIAGWSDRIAAKAPGADDNASGIASITEALQILLKSDWRPKKTLKFMSYAAEEVGLKGSQEIADNFQSEGKQVVGVMQLDMTAFIGPSGKIGLIRDHTSDALSEFTGSLINKYVDIGYINDECGYACSDHASWTSAGYPAVMPFETTYDGMNHKIHTSRDTLDNADASGEHSSQFAKLALAFMIEISK